MRTLYGLILLAGCGFPVVDGAAGADEATAGSDGPPSAVATEIEDNDHPMLANPLADAEEVHGSLPDGDVDCFSLNVRSGWFLHADVGGVLGCPGEAMLQLFDPDGEAVATAWPDPERGCSPIDPEVHEAARSLSQTGTWTVCARGLMGAPVPDYRLWIDVGDPCTDATLALLVGC